MAAHFEANTSLFSKLRRAPLLRFKFFFLPSLSSNGARAVNLGGNEQVTAREKVS